jgi:hypothetical protein
LPADGMMAVRMKLKEEFGTSSGQLITGYTFFSPANVKCFTSHLSEKGRGPLAVRIWSGVIIHRSNSAFRKQAPLKLQPFIRTSEKTVCEKSVSVQSALKKVADDI